MLPLKKFKSDTLSALNNKQLRVNFKKAMDGLIEKRRDVFRDYDELLKQVLLYFGPHQMSQD